MKRRLLLLALIVPILSFSQSTATYDITFDSVWNEDDHGINTMLPSNAHWSNLVGATHNNQTKIWEVGGLASLGVERVAEIGSNDALENEINNNANANQWLQQGFAPFAAISSATLMTVEVNEDYPLLSLITMIAPSPDWFSGIDSFSLLDENGDWKTGTITIDLHAYDAGTEDGTAYSINNSASNPIETIEPLANMYSFNANKIGTLTIQFISSTLSTSNFETKTVSIAPNPSNGNVTFSNIETNSNIAVYDVLGKLVYNIKATNQTETVNLDHLKSGLYLVKIESGNSKILNKKLIIR